MLHWLKHAASSIANAAPGKVRLFVDDSDGLYKQKDEAGALRVLGNGIKQILKTGTAGLVDTYTITLDDNGTRTFTVTNGDDGRSIVSIARTNGNGAPGTTDTYTITYSEAPLTSTFQVYNGADGQQYTDEMAQDAAALMLTAATHFGISVSYDDANNRLTITNTDRGSTAVTAHVGQADPHGQYILETEKGAANGVATLVNGTVPANQLPSFVDDVLEFASLAAFPATGETGKIYVAVNGANAANPSRQYRWSGTVYTEINPSPGSTDAVVEGSTNLYFTESRVRATVLTGLSLATNAAITAADSVLSAFGKLQKQLSDHFAAVDPHPQYTTDSEAQTIASSAVATHVALADPHSQYTTDVEATSIANAAVSAHAGQADPHSQYLTEAEVAALIPPNKLSARISTLFASTANSTAVQIVLSLSIPSGYLTQGKSFDFDLEGTQSQSAAATNVVGAIFVNNTQLVSAAVAGGTAAQTNRSMRMKGGIMWNGANYLGNITVGISGILPVGAANVAGVAVASATAHNIDIRVQTSTANAANIIRAMVAAIKEI